MNSDCVNQLRTFFKKANNIELVILFGSMASGKYKQSSDVDIAVQLHEPLTSSQKKSLIEQLSLITGRPVDLIDLHKVGEPLLGQILKHGKRLQGSDAQYAELGLKHIYAQADFVPYIERTLTERREKWLNS